MVQLQIKPEDILSGNVKTNYIPTIPGSADGAVKFEWIIRARSGDVVELKAVSDKGGSDSVKVTLK